MKKGDQVLDNSIAASGNFKPPFIGKVLRKSRQSITLVYPGKETAGPHSFYFNRTDSKKLEVYEAEPQAHMPQNRTMPKASPCEKQ